MTEARASYTNVVLRGGNQESPIYVSVY